MPYAYSDSVVIMPVSEMHTMLYRDRTRNIELKSFGSSSSNCGLHLVCCLSCCAGPLSNVRVISQYSYTQLSCCEDESHSNCRHGSNRVLLEQATRAANTVDAL